VYPKEELSIDVLTNFSSSRTEFIERNIANILLKNKPNTTVEKTKLEIPNSEISYPLAQLTEKYKMKLGLINISIKNDSLNVLLEWNKTQYNAYSKKTNSFSPKQTIKVTPKYSPKTKN
jgi:hypothetical protein